MNDGSIAPCPVCAYGLDFEPAGSFEICPCCGTQFAYDDFASSHGELRSQWLEAGAPWFSTSTPPPPDWNPAAQLRAAGLET